MDPSDPETGYKRFRFGTHRKMFVTFFLAYAVLTASFLYIIVVNIHHIVEEEVVNAAGHKAAYISAAVSGRLTEADGDYLAEYLGNVLKDGDIEYARIEGPRGELLSEAGPSGKYAPANGGRTISAAGSLPVVREIGRQEGAFHQKGHRFAVESPVMSDGKAAGTILLGLDTLGVNHRIAAFAYRALEIAAATILAGIALAYILYRRMQGAVKELIGTTGSIAVGDLGRRATVTTGDQLEDLAGAMNRMALAVADRERELRGIRNSMVAMFDGITEGIAHIGSDHRVLHANRAYTALRAGGGGTRQPDGSATISSGGIRTPAESAREKSRRIPAAPRKGRGKSRWRTGNAGSSGSGRTRWSFPAGGRAGSWSMSATSPARGRWRRI